MALRFDVMLIFLPISGSVLAASLSEPTSTCDTVTSNLTAADATDQLGLTISGSLNVFDPSNPCSVEWSAQTTVDLAAGTYITGETFNAMYYYDATIAGNAGEVGTNFSVITSIIGLTGSSFGIGFDAGIGNVDYVPYSPTTGLFIYSANMADDYTNFTTLGGQLTLEADFRFSFVNVTYPSFTTSASDYLAEFVFSDNDYPPFESFVAPFEGFPPIVTPECANWMPLGALLLAVVMSNVRSLRIGRPSESLPKSAPSFLREVASTFHYPGAPDGRPYPQTNGWTPSGCTPTGTVGNCARSDSVAR